MDDKKERELKLLITFVVLVGLGVAGIIWAAWLVTKVTFLVFITPATVPSGTAAAYATLFALPGVIIVGMWKGIQAIRQNLSGKDNEL